MNDVLKDIADARKESQNKFGTFLERAEEDERVALGDQWDSADKEKVKKKGEPALNLNLVGKNCRMVSAQQRQNPMDIVYYPVEGADQAHADVYTATSKWLFVNGQYTAHRNLAFDDTTRTGIGWIAPEMCYDYDPVYGDIILNHESIYSIYPDPYFTKITLEDCDFIIRHKYISKDKAKGLYPDYKKDIDSQSVKSDGIMKPQINTENKVYVTERWYRDYEEITIVINPVTGQGGTWKQDKESLAIFLQTYPEFNTIERTVPLIKLQTSINDLFVVYDNNAPIGLSQTKFPFIPIFGFFAPHYNEENWGMKLSGFARGLIDSQKEKNKTRSILMSGMMRNFSRNRLFIEEGALINPDDLQADRDKPIVVRDGTIANKKIYEFPPPPMDVAMVQLEQMHSGDIKEIGLNPDLLQIEGGSAASAPTSSLQLRREQGLMSVQELFDNLGLANRMLGLYNIDLINMWPREKLERILGESVTIPPDWDDVKENARYDCIVDEKASSPTYRQSIFNQTLWLAQHGAIQIPPQITRKLIDFPADIRKEWDQIDQANAQQQAQLQKLQTDMQKQAIMVQAQTEQIRQQGELLRTKIEEQGEMDRLIKKLTNDLAVAKIKSKKVKNG
jgi:hypothetical protein